MIMTSVFLAEVKAKKLKPYWVGVKGDAHGKKDAKVMATSKVVAKELFAASLGKIAKSVEVL
jgi:hypothetical protein